MRINEVLAAKPTREVVTIRPESTVRELLASMAEHNVGALIVSTDGASVDGIVSERDVVRRLHEDESVLGAAVSTIMTADVHTCEGHASVNELMQAMTQRRIRHVPVVEEGRLVGMASLGDLNVAETQTLSETIGYLEAYISR